MLILDREIERIISNNRTRYIAQNIVRNSEVAEIYVTYDEKTSKHIIRSKVVDRDEHVCYIEINAQNMIVYYDCACYFCDSFSACAHVGATLYALQELSPDRFPFHYVNDVAKQREARAKAWEDHQRKLEQERKHKLALSRQNESREFIQSFLPSIDIPKHVNKMKIYIVGELNGSYSSIKFQVGDKKKYIIKDYRTFLMNVEMKKDVSYGKNLSFNHDIHNFDDESKRIIEFMRELSIFPVDQYAYDRDKVIYLNGDVIDIAYDFLDTLDKEYYDFDLEEINTKPTIHFDKEGQFYNVYSTLGSEDPIIGNKYSYTTNKYTITRNLFKYQEKTYRLFKKLCEESIYLLEEDKEMFNRHVLADILEAIEVTGMEIEMNHVWETSRELFGDIDDAGDITMELRARYETGEVLLGDDVPMEKRSSTLETLIQHLNTHSDKIMNGIYHFDSMKDHGYDFVHNHLPLLAPYCEIFVSDAIESLQQKKNVSFSVGITIKNDLLEIDVDSIDIPSDELQAVLDTYKRKKKYHKLKNGQVITMDLDGFTHLDDMFKKYDVSSKDFKDGKTTVPMYRAFSLEEDAKTSKELQFNRSNTFKKVMENITNTKHDPLTIKEQYLPVLREYQEEGVQWLHTLQNYHFNGILADDMGLGKTLQAITLLDSHHTGTSLVIAPASLLLNWQDEITKFAPDLKAEVIHGSKQARKAVVSSALEYDILITSYDYIRRDTELYQGINFEYVVLDEAQYIKNPKTKNAQSVKTLQAKHRLVLTGTPIENSLAELWSIFDFLMKGYLYSYSHFQKRFEIPIVKEKDEKAQEELKKLITPFVLRRTKKEVLKELPDKIEKTITIEFNDAQHKLYLGNLMQVNENLQSQLKVDAVNKIQILAMLTRLRQICCDPRLVYENMDHPSSKMEACLELIETLKENNKKILLFSSFTSLLDLLQIELTKRNISHYVLTGSVDKAKRRQLVQQFQEDDTTIFLISLKAGGTGLNLTAAEAVIHYDPWWNMSAQNQATDRAHRIGQKNILEVYKLIMEGSIEQKIATLQLQKKDLADAFVEGNEGSISAMSSQEIIDLFKP